MISAFVGVGGENLIDVAHVVLLHDRRGIDPEVGQLLCRGVVELDLRQKRGAQEEPEKARQRTESVS